MAGSGFSIGARKAEERTDPAVEAARRKRLDERLLKVERARHSGAASAFHGEGRADLRERVYRVGSAMFEPGHETSCRVIDQSYSGLLLEFHVVGECPDEFALTIPTLRFIGVVRKAWQREAKVGVSILRWSDSV